MILLYLNFQNQIFCFKILNQIQSLYKKTQELDTLSLLKCIINIHYSEKITFKNLKIENCSKKILKSN